MPKGVTQEQCAGMMDHLAQLASASRLTLCMRNVKMALKQTLVRPGWDKQAQHLKSNARPSQITLRIMSHKPCASRPSQHLVRYCGNRAIAVTASENSSKPCEHLHAPAAGGCDF
jgi:hypothetical protein